MQAVQSVRGQKRLSSVKLLSKEQDVPFASDRDLNLHIDILWLVGEDVQWHLHTWHRVHQIVDFPPLPARNLKFVGDRLALTDLGVMTQLCNRLLVVLKVVFVRARDAGRPAEIAVPGRRGPVGCVGHQRFEQVPVEGLGGHFGIGRLRNGMLVRAFEVEEETPSIAPSHLARVPYAQNVFWLLKLPVSGCALRLHRRGER